MIAVASLSATCAEPVVSGGNSDRAPNRSHTYADRLTQRTRK